MTQYYINWSRATGRYLVFEVGKNDCLKIFDTKKEASDFIKWLEK